jgi:hypothetical protein
MTTQFGSLSDFLYILFFVSRHGHQNAIYDIENGIPLSLTITRSLLIPPPDYCHSFSAGFRLWAGKNQSMYLRCSLEVTLVAA